MKVTRVDPFTGRENTLDLPITEEELSRWDNGELIQNVWPDLSPDQREFIKTGIMATSWDKYLREETEEC